MLEHLFGSRTRVKLLNLFLRNPQEPIFVRELSRRVGTQINAVRRELSNLVQLGMIVETDAIQKPGLETRKQPGLKKKYYRINPAFVLLPDLTALLLKAQVLLEKRLDQELDRAGDVKYLAFLGIFLGNRTQTVPVDIFIVGKVDKKRVQELVNGAEAELGVSLNFSCMTPEEYEYRKEVADRFLTAIADMPKAVVIDRLQVRP